MQQWTYEQIAPEQAERLPECRFYRFGGFLFVLLALLLVHGATTLSMLMKLIAGLLSNWALLTAEAVPIGFLALYGAQYLVPLLLIIWTLLLLKRRSYAFRIVFTVYMAVQICALALNLAAAGWRTPFPFVAAMVAYGAWIVYAFCSDRARVFCNRLPKRPVPMPAPQNEAEDEPAPAYPAYPRYTFAAAPAGKTAHKRLVARKRG